MTITAPVPQVAIGYAHAPQYNWWLYENETTTELIWPQSVYVYDQMRRTDSQVTSVLRAMTLPVRRTPWRIDPNGARPEVVQLVADDLGLPIVGGKVTAPPRSKDRFSWADHLRQALLMLPFGHMYFEVLYRVTPDGNRAHLRKLEPRMPRTIERIEVAPDGGLISISQYWTNLEDRPKPIPVDRLVAYIHEKEGGNWLGTSILRPAYKNWLLKDRLLRVQAQTIERNGMGIPLATAPENATDLSTYLAMAKAWRAGEAAGTALPFGASLKLVGVEGTLPDAEPAIRYHDEQIGRAVLAHFLNLGTQTGSWALGTTFADFFTLSLQTLADQIADTATQHIIEDLVDVNFGESEPAPRLVCDEIGSRQAATAEALKTLIDAGVIQPDDVLDESSRQQYGLPPRDPKTTRTPPSAATGTVQAPPAMGATSVAAAFREDELRLPDGRWTDTPGVADALKLAGRIDLAPGESLASSREVDLNDGVARVAVTDMSGHRSVRLGLGGAGFAESSWRAAPKGLTVKLSPGAVGDLVAGLDSAGARAKKEAAAADKLWNKVDQGSADPGLLAKAQAAVSGLVQPSGEVTGEWGRVHLGYRVHDTGTSVTAAVRPDNAPSDWNLEDAVAEGMGVDLDPADLRKLIKLLEGVKPVAASAAEPDEDDEWEEDIELLAAVLTELSGQVVASFNEAEHLRNPKGSVGGGRFRSMFDRIVDALKEHHASGGKGQPFKDFDREQLRRVAVKQGITLKRGATHKEISDRLVEHVAKPDSLTHHKGDAKPDVASGGTVRSAAVPKIPDLLKLDPAELSRVLKDAIEGDYPGGLRVTNVDGGKLGPDKIFLGGDIVNADGKKVGYFNREFERSAGKQFEDPKGTWNAYHESLYVTGDAQYQGQGFGRAFNDNLIDWYKRSGVSYAWTSPGGEVGGYAWPAAGWDFSDADDIREFVDNIDTGSSNWSARKSASEADADLAELDKLVARVESGQWVTAQEFSQVGRKPGQGKDDMWLGKAAMMNSPHGARLWFDETMRRESQGDFKPPRQASAKPSDPEPLPAAARTADASLPTPASRTTPRAAGSAAKMAELDAMSSLDARDALDSMTRPEVYALAQHLGEKGISRHRKRELVDLVLTHHQADAGGGR